MEHGLTRAGGYHGTGMVVILAPDMYIMKSYGNIASRALAQGRWHCAWRVCRYRGTLARKARSTGPTACIARRSPIHADRESVPGAGPEPRATQ
jgi:hypothetical protein